MAYSASIGINNTVGIFFGSGSYTNTASRSPIVADNTASLARQALLIEKDPDDPGSIQFRIPASKHGGDHDRIAFYISSSGFIGIGTKDPQDVVDIRDNTQDVRPSGSAANDGGGNPGKTEVLKLNRTSGLSGTIDGGDF